MNKIFKILEENQIKGFEFHPTRKFYKKIGIGQKRWGQLVRNEKPANLDELKSIADYFEVSLTELIEI